MKPTINYRQTACRLLAVLFFFLLLAPMAAGQDASPTDSNWKEQISDVDKIVNDKGGDGTKGKPILIASAKELAYFAQQVNESKAINLASGGQIEPGGNDSQINGFFGYYFALSANIDLSEHFWTPIGISISNPFNGNFDGKGHCVSGLKVLVTEGNNAYAGLFGNAFVGTIQNLGVCVAKEGVRITNTDGANYAGGIAGSAQNVHNCYVAGDGSIEITGGSGSSNNYAGGIVGYLYSDASLSNCYATVDIKIEVEGGRYAGGIVGHSSYNSTISCTYATGDVEIGTEAISYYAGGICGYLLGSSRLEYSLALNERITGGYDEEGNSLGNRIVGLKETNATLTSNYASAKTLVNDHRVSSNLDDPNGVDIWLGTFAEDLKNASPANNDWNTAWIWPEGKLPQLNNIKHEQPEIDARTVLTDLQDLSLELNESSGKIFLTYKDERWLYNEPESENPTIPFNGVVKGGGCPITIQNTVLKTKATDAPVLTFDGGTWSSSEQNAILKINAGANMIMKVTNNVAFINTGGPAIDNAGTLTIEAESSNSLSAISPNGAIRNTGTLALQGNSIYLAGGASTIDNKGTDVVFYSPMVEWQFNSSLQGKLLNWESSRFSLQGDQFATCRSFATSVFSAGTFSLTAGPSDGSSAPVTQQGCATDGTYTTAFSTQGGQQLTVFTDVKSCPRLHLVQPSGGSLTIVGTNGMSLSDGDYVTTGTELTLSCSTEANFYLQGYLSGTAANSLSALTGNTVTIGDNDIWLGASLRYENPTPPTPVYYSVYLPQVEGATTDPGPGEYEVESWSTFRFYLTLDSAYSESQPVVTTSRGETLVPRTSDGAYLVKYVRTDVEVFIDGIVQNPPPVANEVISTDALAPQIWAEGSMLCIRMPEALPSALVRIFTPDGRLYDSFDSTPGLNRRQLPTGMYIVRVGDAVRKVVVRKT